LIKSIVEGSDAQFQQILSVNKSSVNAQDEQGNSLLLLAARRGFETKMRLLLQAGANPNLRNHNGSAPLLGASMNGQLGAVRLLLENGAEVNAETKSNDTSISLAVWKNHTEVALVLMNTGADVTHVDKFGDTLLLDAARHGNVCIAGARHTGLSLPTSSFVSRQPAHCSRAVGAESECQPC